MDERDEIRKWIKTRVGEHWEATKQALLLSQIGGALRHKFANFSALVPEGLKQFLATDPFIQVVTHPTVPEKIGMVPDGIEIPGDVTSLFGRVGAVRTRSALKTPQQSRYFIPDFWRAFFSPLTGRRFVVLPVGTQLAQIIDTQDPPDEPYYEILDSDIVSLPQETPMVQKVQAVHRAIQNWLTRNGLSEGSFIDREYRPRTAMRPMPLSERPSSFAEALANLEPSEQARIFVPLDLVQRMLSGRR